MLSGRRGSKMAKFLLLFMVIAVGYLFYPFHDLYIRKDPFSSEYTLAVRGYWTHDACTEEAASLKAYAYKCRKRTNFASLIGVSNRYGNPHRE
jgi:hypothetical protein